MSSYQYQDAKKIIEFCTKAIQIQPDFVAAYYNRGNVHNRHTTSSNAPSKAFKAMYQEIKERVSNLKGEGILLNDDDHEIFKEIPDAHAVAITASETAIPISSLRSTSYELQHGKTQIQHDPLDRYTKAIAAVIPLLS